jgi:hypothetical protein
MAFGPKIITCQTLMMNFLLAFCYTYCLYSMNIVGIGLLTVKINSLDPKTVNFYPNYLHLNFYHLPFTISNVMSLPVTLLYYAKHKEIVNDLEKKEWKEVALRF